MRRNLWIVIGACSLFVLGCTDPFEDIPDGSGSDASFTDGMGNTCTDPKGDEDSDGISNGDEGCVSGRDSDGDKIPDWQDFDSDDDGIYDDLEKGEKDSKGKCKGAKAPDDGWPCDSDKDGVPDYLDVDSDGDGLLDKDEDANGDGQLGCCIVDCKKPLGKQQQECLLTTDGCGSGQKCVSGKCTPAVGFGCSNGETDPTNKDTFGDGKLDNERGTFICRDATEDKPQGRKPIQKRKSDSTKGGDWHIALETSAKYGELAITGAKAKEAAAVIDMDDTMSEVAGFVISLDTTDDKVQDSLTAIMQALNTKPPGGTGTLTQRASGTQGKSHDKFDFIEGTILDLALSSASNVSTVRNELVGTLLSKQMSDLGNLPSPYGSSHSDFVIRFVSVKRVEFKTDKDGDLVDKDDKKIKVTGGDPMDSGDKTKWRLMIMGAIAGKSNYQDAKRKTGFNVDDLSNGTSLARANDKVYDECDVGTITSLPVADIIWVIDESGSMSDNRNDIVNNANNFFSRALSSGLDFRMGVTNVCSPTGSYKSSVGHFCSQVSTNTNDLGGADRFLLPSEQTIFSSCIKNPPGYEGGSEYGIVNAKEAVTKHLPRATGAPDKIRPNAKLVIIIATDEVPESFSSAIGYSNFDVCKLPATTQTSINTALQPYLSLFNGTTDPEAAAMFHVIGGVCNNSCNADVSHGYKELAQQLGGQIGDVCQKDLGNTLQVIIDSIVAGASPLSLEYVPISSSLAVAMDGVEINRDRTNGFDYRTTSTGPVLVFINVKYKKGSEVIASYKRWEQGVVLE
jgi:hypothetical protein